jgi:3-hydroxyisobutyrate dehydrogenase
MLRAALAVLALHANGGRNQNNANAGNAVMQIGLAGLGGMGSAIAARLMEVGHDVTVWNRTPAKTKPLADAGAKLAATPAALAGAVDTVITILTDAAAIDSVYNGPDGLLSGDVTGKLFVEMSTVLPQTQVELAAKVRAKGAAFVECPVGGSIAPARQGKLLGLMGAEPEDAARAKPVLEQLCRRVEHCGPVGTGETVKLAINLPLMVAWQAYGEAFAMCRDLGWKPQRLVDLFADSNGANAGFKLRAPLIVEMLSGDEPSQLTFTIANAVKDIRLMLDAGRAKGAALPATERALAGFEEARGAGFGARDASSLAVYWAQHKKS